MADCYVPPDVTKLQVPDSCVITPNIERTTRAYVLGHAVVASVAWVLEKYGFEVPEVRRVDYGSLVISPDCCEQIAVAIQPTSFIRGSCNRMPSRSFLLAVSGCRPDTIERREEPDTEDLAALWASQVEEALSVNLVGVLSAVLSASDSSVTSPCGTIEIGNPRARKQKCLGVEFDLTIS